MVKLRFAYTDRYIDSQPAKDRIRNIIRLRINSMSATSGPPIGPVLGQYGIPLSKFCSESNERSKVFSENVAVFVTLHYYMDGHFTFELSAPISSICYKRAAGIQAGYGRPGRAFPPRRRGILTTYMLYEAIEFRNAHSGGLGDYTMRAAFMKGLGTLRSIGIHALNTCRS
jgi:large subunit ribosomal protein L11